MCYEKTIKTLSDAGISSPRLEARLLIAHILHIDANNVSLKTTIPENLRPLFEIAVQKRLQGMPLDKILGHKEFYKYDFITSEDVLSPRPDTEILLEAALDLTSQNAFQNVLDLGVGSGCILLSLLKENTNIQGVGVDISLKALNIAEQNANRLNVKKRCRFLNKSWFDEDFISALNQHFDLIVSNPPYIKTEDISSLDIEVRQYDPTIALDGGSNGFKDYVQIAKIAPQLLNTGGYIALEVGIDQALKVRHIFEQQGLKHIQTTPDLAGIERVVIFQK